MATKTSKRRPAPKKRVASRARRAPKQSRQRVTPATSKDVKSDHSLVLRCCQPDGSSSNGFVWPKSGLVACNDFRNTRACGNGLHGWLWGEGDVTAAGGVADQADALWLVVEVETKKLVELGGKVKFPSGNVIFSGSRFDAVKFISERAPSGTKVIYGTATAGYGGTATAGVRGTATAGERGTLSIAYYDHKRDKYRVAIAEVGEEGIKPNTAYTLDLSEGAARFIERVH